MNKDCAIARDLMPPVIDQIASEQSRIFVEEHVADCKSCAQVYADMQSEIQAMETGTAADNELSFKAAMAQLRKTMGWKRLKTAVLAVVLTAVLIIVGYGGYYYLCEYSSYPTVRALPPDAYGISLYQTSKATVYGLVILTQNYSSCGSLVIRHDENDDTILYIYWTAPIIPIRKLGPPDLSHYFTMRMTMTGDGSLTRDGDTAIREIRKGKPNDYRVVYRAGDAIPPLDPETDAKYWIQDTYDRMDAAQQMRKDAEQMDIDAQETFYEALDQLENGETPAPTVE